MVRRLLRALKHLLRQVRVLVGLHGLHVIEVVADQAEGRLTVTADADGLSGARVIAASHGRRTVVLVGAPVSAARVRVLWR